MRGSSGVPLLSQLTLHDGATSGTAAITPQADTIGPGDDLRCARFSLASTGGSSPISSYQLYTTSLSPAVTLSAGQVLTAVAWVTTDALVLPGSLYEVLSIDLTENLGSSHLAIYYDSSTDSRGLWGADIGLGGLSGTISSGRPVALNSPTPIAIRYGYSPSVFEFWIGSTRTVGTLSGTAPTSTTLAQITAPPNTFSGLYGHVQLYVGATTDWDFTRFSAQVDAGNSGLAGQRTGDRIVTLAQYAGVPTTDLDFIDQGEAQLQRASLAGKTPLTAMREAETTEQGRLRTNGQGLIVFDPRTRRYNS